MWITGGKQPGSAARWPLQLAHRGYVVAATARASDSLDRLAAESERMSGAIRAFPCDVTDRDAMHGTVGEIENP